MMSLSYIIGTLYPRRSQEELDRMFDDAMKLLKEYDARQWNQVTRQELEDKEVQLALVKTLYQTQFNPDGVTEEIMRSIESWSDGLIMFEDINPEDQEFWQRLYGFFGWLHFADLQTERQCFLLRSRFLLLAAAWEIPMYISVQEYFRKTTYVDGMRDAAALFASMLERNETYLFEGEKRGHKVSDWVQMFRESATAVPGNLVDTFFEDNVAVGRMPIEAKETLNKLLTLYAALGTGVIWKEITEEVPAGFEKKEKTETDMTAEDYYLQLLEEGGSEEIGRWLEDYSQIAEWIAGSGKGDDFVNQLLYILSTHVDLENDDQIENLMHFVSELAQKGWELGIDMIYFDESTGEFNWNEKMVEALKEEVEYIKQTRASRPQVGRVGEEEPENLAEGIKDLTT